MTDGAGHEDVEAAPLRIASAVGGLPLAVVLVDGTGRVLWSNDVAREVGGRSEEGVQRALDAVARAVLEVDGPVVVARLPGDRGLLERELWVAPVGEGARLVTFHPELPARTDAERHHREVARLEAMLEHTHDLMTIIDRDATVIVSNGAAGRLSGLSGAMVNGADAFSLVHPDDVDRTAVAFAEVLATPGPHPPVEVRLRFADDAWHDVEATPINLLDVPGVDGVVIAMHDITDRKRAEAEVQKSHAYLQSLIENLTDVIVVLDERFEVAWASPALATIIDAPVETNLGMSAFNDMHPDDLERVVESLTTLAGGALGDQVRVELRLEVRPGSDRWRWIEATAVNRLADPHVGGIVCTLRDVSGAKEAERELQAAFERERRAAERLRELDVLKDQFLASVSHEMRTPLAIIIGFADLLAKEDAITPEIQRDAVERIRTSATEMRGMVENLLDYSELEAGNLTVRTREVPLRRSVEATVGTVRALVVDHPVTIDVPDDLAALADPDGIDRVLRNLLANAAKYSTAGRAICVAGRREGAEAVLDVMDEGVGIPEDQLALVFERLYRAPGAAFVARGSGVGLNMVRRYVELMGGSVSVRSVVGEGSTFTVRLPIA